MAYSFNPFTGNFDDLGSLQARLREANSVYVSMGGSDTNSGASQAEPLRTLAAAAAVAQSGDVVFVSPGSYAETLPIRWRRGVTVFGSGLRSTIVRPAVGYEYSDIFKVDSGFWAWGLSFAGHQANSALGQQSWAVSFDELADNRAIGAIGLGAYILASPYIQNCTSITAEDDGGQAGSSSTGDTGGGINIDGGRCALNSPIRSMVVDSYTQVNLGGPGCLVQNDGYAQLVSFFGTFCDYHVKTLTGGQVNLSGGGTTDFGNQGLVADGYSPTPLYTGRSRLAYYGAERTEKAVTINAAIDTFSSAGHTLLEGDQVTFAATQGSLPAPLSASTTYYVIAGGLTADAFKVSTSSGGAAIDITGPTTGAYKFTRQGANVIDVIGFTANRLGRQIKYPTAGSLGSAGSPVLVAARGGSTPGSTFTVTLDTTTIGHEYVGGGTVTVGSSTYEVISATYNGATGVGVFAASGYAPTIGDSLVLSGLSFICNSASRPNTGQLMFPQLIFPRNSATEAPEAKTFAYTRTGNYTLTYSEATASSGPDHQYVSGGTAVIGGTDYGVANATYSKSTGVVTLTTRTQLPIGNGSVTVDGLRFICPTSAYVVTSSVPIDSSGNEVANTSSSRAGYRVYFYSGLNGGLRYDLAVDQVLDFRNRSQIAAPGHTFEYVGSGTNYNALPQNGGIPVPANRVVELNNGRVYTSNTDELGNFAVGDQFSIDGTSGAVTINTDQFNLSGLNAIGPFSRNGGFSTVGVQIQEASNNTSLIASTGAPDGNTVPTQYAVKEYAGSRYVTNVTATAGQPIALTGSASADGSGNWTFTRNIELTLNQANGLVRLDGSGLVPSVLLPSYVDDVLEYASLAVFPVTGETSKIYVALDTGKIYRWSGSTYIEISPSPGSTDSVTEGAVNLYYTNTRARGAVSAVGSGLIYNSGTGVFSLDTGTTANKVVLLDGSAKLPAVDGSQLTNLPSSGGSVTSVNLSAPTGFSVSGGPVTGSGTLSLAFASGYSLPTTSSQTNWDIAYTDRLQWDGGSAGLTAATGRASLGLDTSASPQFAFLGIGAAASTLFGLALNGGAMVRHQSVAISGSTYTFDVGVASEFTCGAAINGATTFALSNHDQLPAASSGVGWRTRVVVTFTWTSGAITFSASGYTFSQAAVTLASGQTYNAILTMTSSSTVIGVQYSLGRT